MTFDLQFGGEIVFDEGSAPAQGTKVNVMLDWLFDTVVWHVDVFDNHHFGGRSPAGTKRSVNDGRTIVTTDVEGAHSNDPEAKQKRWGQ